MNDRIKSIETDDVPKSNMYSQAVVINAAEKIIFVSGQLPLNPESGKLLEGNIQEMTRQILKNMEAILIKAGSSLNFVVRIEIFSTDLKKDFPAINEEYGRHFTSTVKPTRQSIEVSNLPMGSPLEISCIAILP